MTAEEFISGAKIYFDPIQFNIVLNLMEGYSKHMCEKQREICADGSERLWIANNYCQIDQMCNTIIYSPLPKELQ